VEYLEHHRRLPTPNPYGALGKCAFMETLPYFDMAYMLIVPASHGLLRGLCYDLWQYIFHPTRYKPTPPAGGPALDEW